MCYNGDMEQQSKRYQISRSTPEDKSRPAHFVALCAGILGGAHFVALCAGIFIYMYTYGSKHFFSRPLGLVCASTKIR